jgi:DNA polymerase-3 subunit delta'|tara:strand:+ start:600 stop:1532 length:933 start_codon:yes stop_codon:yes gene_type:complete
MLFENINPRHSTQLYGLDLEFDRLSNLLINQKLPKVILLTGEKGIGKFTLINHLVISYFDKENYNLLEKKIINKNKFFENLSNNLISNVIFLDSNDFKNINVETIRDLKNKLQKKPFYNDKRLIILDDVETFNTNSINALLKIIEEPNDNDYFLLINNKTRLLIDTLKSRCLEFKIILNNRQRVEITNFLMNKHNQKIIIDQNKIMISPGNFLRFNIIFNENSISLKENILKTSKIILDLYKKSKNLFFKDLLLFYSEYYLNIKKDNKHLNKIKFIEDRDFLLKKINDFFVYNLNQSTLLRSIENRFSNE